MGRSIAVALHLNPRSAWACFSSQSSPSTPSTHLAQAGGGDSPPPTSRRAFRTLAVIICLDSCWDRRCHRGRLRHSPRRCGHWSSPSSRGSYRRCAGDSLRVFKIFGPRKQLDRRRGQFLAEHPTVAGLIFTMENRPSINGPNAGL